MCGHTASFITAEDIVVAKLVAYRTTGSDKHLRDARGVLWIQWGTLDLVALRRHAATGQVLELLEHSCEETLRSLLAFPRNGASSSPKGPFFGGPVEKKEGIWSYPANQGKKHG